MEGAPGAPTIRQENNLWLLEKWSHMRRVAHLFSLLFIYLFICTRKVFQALF